MDNSVIHYIGYAASIIIAISMAVNSIVKFRWINLAGAMTFAIYGFVIGAIPVGLLNSFIVCVDIFYLRRIYAKKDVFEILEITPGSKYLERFLQFHKKEIQRFFPGFKYDPAMNTVSFFILRNMNVAGIFLAHRKENMLSVGLDYVIPAYRDYKNGKHIYLRVVNKFTGSGIDTVVASAKSDEYGRYLRKLGFSMNEEGLYQKRLKEIN
jgi:hypothetical protein